MKRIRMCFLFLVLTSVSCTKEKEIIGPRYGAVPKSGEIPIYSFAVHPLYNPLKLMNTYQPLIDYINSRMNDVEFHLEASRDYANFEKKYRDRKPDVLLPNPWQTLQAMKAGYHVVAMAGDPADFKGIFIVRRDGDIRQPLDLKGKRVSYPSPTALAACIMPQYFLYSHGIDVNTDIDSRYVGSQESSIMNAYLKQTSAGATWPPPWRAFQKDHPEEAAELKVIWETEPLVNNSVMIRDDIPVDIQRRITDNLSKLHETAEGKTILEGMETARFIVASDKDYDIVRAYVERFEELVRKVDVR
ncbi:MAG TPA: phosphonate ABC transporter substrate-binding protein [Treponema sp.]|nr:MAG: phosphonate ABC transporter substrate-binding protein [Treponema sp. GWC1_61_84]HCM25929.1 phosphonate ABC transporter substrate-binding protein [Treponema sp.]